MGAVRSGIDICLEFRVGGSLSLTVVIRVPRHTLNPRVATTICQRQFVSKTLIWDGWELPVLFRMVANRCTRSRHGYHGEHL